MLRRFPQSPHEVDSDQRLRFIGYLGVGQISATWQHMAAIG
jgi:hypothetical protein